MDEQPNRCRLVLLANTQKVRAENIDAALRGGDVASVILYHDDADCLEHAEFCEKAVPFIQSAGAATIIADQTQIFGRSGADGILAATTKPQLSDHIARFSPQNIVGCGNIKSRHQALEIGELKPDFLFFGKLGGDIRPEPHKKNLELAHWWSELVNISAIVVGGNELKSALICAETGAEFLALEDAVFSHPEGPKSAVEVVNQMLDQHAPIFVEEDE